MGLCVCLYRGGYRGEGLFWAALYDTRRRVGERVDDSRSRKRHSLTTHTHTFFPYAMTNGRFIVV